MSICTENIAKAINQQEGTPINWHKTNTSLKPDNTCKGIALSPYPELNQDLPEHLDDLAIMYGRHFGE